MTITSWEWEVRTVNDGEPVRIRTSRDCLSEVNEKVIGLLGPSVSVYSIRKTSKIIDYTEVS